MDQGWVIRPGQEDALADMMGRGVSLPGPCTFTGGQVNAGVVSATYMCPSGEVALELRAGSVAHDHLLRSERFAVTTRGGSAPPELLEALLPRIRAGESAIGWSAPPSDHGSGRALPSSAALWLGVVLVASALAVALWRRHRRDGLRSALVADRRTVRRTLVVVLCGAAVVIAAEGAYRGALYVVAWRDDGGDPSTSTASASRRWWVSHSTRRSRCRGCWSTCSAGRSRAGR